jgi:hypothetical protein
LANAPRIVSVRGALVAMHSCIRGLSTRRWSGLHPTVDIRGASKIGHHADDSAARET